MMLEARLALIFAVACIVCVAVVFAIHADTLLSQVAGGFAGIFAGLSLISAWHWMQARRDERRYL